MPPHIREAKQISKEIHQFIEYGRNQKNITNEQKKFPVE